MKGLLPIADSLATQLGKNIASRGASKLATKKSLVDLPNLDARPLARTSLALAAHGLRTSAKATQPKSGGGPRGAGREGRKTSEELGRPEDGPGSKVLPKVEEEDMIGGGGGYLQREAGWPILIQRRHLRGSRQRAARCPRSKQRKQRPERDGLRRYFGGWGGKKEVGRRLRGGKRGGRWLGGGDRMASLKVKPCLARDPPRGRGTTLGTGREGGGIKAEGARAKGLPPWMGGGQGWRGGGSQGGDPSWEDAISFARRSLSLFPSIAISAMKSESAFLAILMNIYHGRNS